MALSLRAALGLSKEYVDVASKTLSEDLASHQRAWQTFTNDVEAKLPELAATFRSSKTDEKHQGQLRELLNAARSGQVEEADRWRKAFGDVAARATFLHAADGQMVEICLSVNADGDITQATVLQSR
jgi:DNA invertase Pin-like site-specific DNA recombinase